MFWPILVSALTFGSIALEQRIALLPLPEKTL